MGNLHGTKSPTFASLLIHSGVQRTKLPVPGFSGQTCLWSTLIPVNFNSDVNIIYDFVSNEIEFPSYKNLTLTLGNIHSNVGKQGRRGHVNLRSQLSGQ